MSLVEFVHEHDASLGQQVIEPHVAVVRRQHLGKQPAALRVADPISVARRGFAKRVSLGEHGKLTPEEARRLARLELGNVARGDDPASARSKRKSIPTVKELGETYLSDTETRLKARTSSEYRRASQSATQPTGVRTSAGMM